jgi:hypothetical protein
LTETRLLVIVAHPTSLSRVPTIRQMPMRHGVLFIGLFFGGCILEGPSSPWLGRLHPFQGPSGSDVIQLDLAILEGPIADRVINQDLWRIADEQATTPEVQKILVENGFHVGQMGGIAPPELQRLLTSERSCIQSRRVQLRSGSARKIILGPPTASCQFVLHDSARESPVTLENARCVLSVVPTLTEFTPEIESASSPSVHSKENPWQRALASNSQELSTERYPAIGWEITLAPNDYVIIGGRYDRPKTLGWTSFIRPDEATPVQRVLVLRTTRSLPSVADINSSSTGRKPVSLGSSPSLAAQASEAPLHGNRP